jgi:hypothetical protein
LRFNRSLILAVFLLAPFLASCAGMVATAGSGMAKNLNNAIMNQDDPELVRDGAPAYLLMLDSFVEGSPENIEALSAAAQLYAAYGVIFVDDPLRARKLTARAREYGRRALCSADSGVCGIWDEEFEGFSSKLQKIEHGEIEALYAFSLSWIAYIQAHSEDYAALAKLPHAQASLQRVREIDPAYNESEVEHYLAVLDTVRPPALGGDFESGLAHFERALDLSRGRNLSILVDFARYYARTLYDRELHDILLRQVLDADPVQPGYTLFNTLAQDEAKELLASADDYF